MTDSFKVTFHGVRGSIPAPLRSIDVENKIEKVLAKATPEDIVDKRSIKKFLNGLSFEERGTVGSNSTCLQISVGGYELFFDGGSGCFRMASQLFAGPFGRGKGEAYWFITHTHHDHLMGIPMFGPLYIPGNKFHFVSPIEDLEQRFIRYYHADFFPVPFQALGATVDFVHLKEDTYQIGDVKISWLTNDHPGASYSYRIEYKGKSVVLSTDAEYKHLSFQALQPVVDFFAGADILIFDAQYAFTESVALKRDWGHSSSMVGIDMALDAGVKNLYLFHHDPMFSDEKLVSNLKQARKYLQNMEPGSKLNIELSIEGEELELLAKTENTSEIAESKTSKTIAKAE